MEGTNVVEDVRVVLGKAEEDDEEVKPPKHLKDPH